MILVDTSIWVDHLPRSDALLAKSLLAGAVATQSFVIGELALGGLRKSGDALSLLQALPRLWTRDKRLHDIAEEHSWAFAPVH